MSYKSMARPGSEGNTRLLKSYGGGSSPPRQSYASGGAVAPGGSPSLDEGLSAAAGAPAKSRLDRPGRKMSSKGKDKGKKGTHVNVIVAPSSPPAGGPIPIPVPVGGPGGPGGPPPMPPMPPPGPPMGGPMGGPPPGMKPPGGPMMNTGGRVGRASGGSVATDAEAKKFVHEHEESMHKGKGLTQLRKGGRVKRDMGGATQTPRDDRLPNGSRSAVGKGPEDGSIAPLVPPFGALGSALGSGSLGAISEEDRRRMGRSVGGPAKPPTGITGGGRGGLARLQKAKKYGAGL